MAIDGDTAIIGAFYDDDKDTDSGSAYLFARSGESWSQQQKLTADDGAGGDLFGRAVAVSGNTTILGSERDDSLTGSAYISELTT